MGMPNIPPNIKSHIDIDKDDIKNLFTKTMYLNKEALRKFFDNEVDFKKIFRKYGFFSNEKEKETEKKVSKSFEEIKSILNEKEKIEREKMSHLNKKNHSLKINYLFLILFILLSALLPKRQEY